MTPLDPHTDETWTPGDAEAFSAAAEKIAAAMHARGTRTLGELLDRRPNGSNP